MHCRTCDYSLWNLKPGPCPECGTEFKPSSFRFRPNAVEFRCPHCSQRYFGTSATGHLEPQSFRCATCGTDVTMDAMLVVPAADVPEDETGVRPLAWEEREKLGVWTAWWRTVVRTLATPGDAMQAVHATTPLGRPILFAALTVGLGAIVAAALAMVGTGALAVVQDLSGAALTRLILVQLALQGSNVAFVIIATLISGFVAHLVLLALRGARGGLNRTMQATLYATGSVYALAIIPCPCFSLASIPWWIVALTIMYRVAHTTTIAKGLAATIVAAIASVAVTASLALIPQGLGMTQQSSFINVNRGATVETVAAVGSALEVDAAIEGTWAISPLEVVARGRMSGADLARIVSLDGGDMASIGQLDPERLRSDDREAIALEAARIAPRFAGDQAPFRWGRTIFCYRDAPLEDQSAWLAIVEPRRSESGVAQRMPWGIITVGGVTRLSNAEFVQALAAENGARAASGRPSIPDPASLADALTGQLPAPIIRAASPAAGDGAPAATPDPADDHVDPGAH